MIVARLALLSIVFSAGFVASQTNDTPKLSTIAGRVVKAADGQPLKNAQIRLAPISADQRSHGSGAITDADGNFKLTAIAPGQYHLSASKNGYVSQSFKARSAYQEGAILTLAPGQEITDAIFRLIAASAITGRVVNEDDEPEPGVEVQALIKAKIEDATGVLSQQSALTPIRFAITNDLGEYRLYALAPGTYFFSAVNSGMPELSEAMVRSGHGMVFTNPSEDTENKYPPLYYPGVFDAGAATGVALHAGEEGRVDFKLQQQHMARISGRVLGINSQPTAGVMVSLEPRELTTLFSGVPSSASSGPDGGFEIKNVPAGAYIISATDSQSSNLPSAQQKIEVSGADIGGLVLALKNPISLHGKVVAPDPLPFKPASVNIFLQPNNQMWGFTAAQVGENAAFDFVNVSEGSYAIRASGLPDGWYLESASFGGSNVLEDGLTVARPMEGTLQLSFSSASAQVNGSVLDGSNAAEGVEVRLQPAKDNPFRRDRNQQTTTDQNGRFQFKNIPPGPYELFVSSTEDDSDDEEASPSPAASLDLNPGAHETVQLSLAAKPPN